MNQCRRCWHFKVHTLPKCWQSKGVSTFANATQLTTHILKSAWCMCPSPQMKARISFPPNAQCLTPPPKKMALFLHMTLNWMTFMSHEMSSIGSGNVFLFCCPTSLTSLIRYMCSDKFQKSISGLWNCLAKTTNVDRTAWPALSPLICKSFSCDL